MTKGISSVHAARKAGISRATLQAWIASGKISAPDVQLVGGKAVRLWTAGDIARLTKFKGTLKPGPKKRGAK
jgi:predicted site-specific integrase-resolvase